MPAPRKPSPRTPRSRTPQATEAALQDAARYREFFENANDALALFTPEEKIALVNRAAEHLLGYTRRELLGQHYRKVVTAAAAKEAVERSRKALAKEPLKSTFTTELVRKDGSVVRVKARDRLVWDTAGKLLGFQGIYRDITERTCAEQSLRESETKYRTIFAVSPDLIYLTDRMGKILDPTCSTALP
jgi:PAS domain S-box-containing protein